MKGIPDLGNERDNRSQAFSGDHYLQAEIQKIIKKFDIFTVVETGTFMGDTTAAFTEMASSVFSIEVNYDLYQRAVSRFQDVSNVMILSGNSPEVLYQMIPAFKTPILFFLDAHWYQYWPILDELRVIAMFAKCRNSVIVIHDFYVPDSDLGYDSYGDKRLDFDFIKSDIYSINSQYHYYYNSQAAGERRGVIFVHP